MSSKTGGPTYTLFVTHLRPSRAFARRSSESFQELNTMVLEEPARTLDSRASGDQKLGGIVRWSISVPSGAFFLFHIDECTRGWHYSPPMFRR
jgi:hypothetical protein